MVIEDLVPLLRQQMPRFFERSAITAIACSVSTTDSEDNLLEAREKEHASVDSYDFSPAAHLRASERAVSARELPSASLAFAASTAHPPPPSVPHGLSAEVRNELKSVETEVKYAGYLLQQQRAMERLKKAEHRQIPDSFEYGGVSGLSREMQEKLAKVRPRTLGQALGIPGVTPAAVSRINIYI